VFSGEDLLLFPNEKSIEYGGVAAMSEKVRWDEMWVVPACTTRRPHSLLGKCPCPHSSSPSPPNIEKELFLVRLSILQALAHSQCARSRTCSLAHALTDSSTHSSKSLASLLLTLITLPISQYEKVGAHTVTAVDSKRYKKQGIFCCSLVNEWGLPIMRFGSDNFQVRRVCVCVCRSGGAYCVSCVFCVLC
jgi:hypothetical protein